MKRLKKYIKIKAHKPTIMENIHLAVMHGLSLLPMKKCGKEKYCIYKDDCVSEFRRYCLTHKHCSFDEIRIWGTPISRYKGADQGTLTELD